mgnify:CR=1 FL=1
MRCVWWYGRLGGALLVIDSNPLAVGYSALLRKTGQENLRGEQLRVRDEGVSAED